MWRAAINSASGGGSRIVATGFSSKREKEGIRRHPSVCRYAGRLKKMKENGRVSSWAQMPCIKGLGIVIMADGNVYVIGDTSNNRRHRAQGQDKNGKVRPRNCPMLQDPDHGHLLHLQVRGHPSALHLYSIIRA